MSDVPLQPAAPDNPAGQWADPDSAPPAGSTTPRHARPTAAEVAAQARAKRAAKDAATPESLEAALAVRRASLAADLTDLGTRLAPQTLMAQASASAHGVAAQARAGFSSAFASRSDDASAARPAFASRPDDGARSGGAARCGAGGAAALASPRALLARLNRLLDDARDGDPASLGLVTAAALVLAGVSAVALVKAVRR